MYLSLNKASKEAGISKSTLSEALNNGRLTAQKDDKGRWQIDPAALFQVFPKTSSNEQVEPKPNPEPNVDLRIEIAELKASLKAEQRLTESLSDQIGDLRERLDKEGEERRKLTAMLTDQREAQKAPQTTQERKGVFSRVFG